MNEILKIVIADDNQAIVGIMKGWIEKNERYKVIGMARDEEEEIKLIEELKPDLVITDLKKKNGWTGLEIIEKYINDSEYSPIFFIISAATVNNIEDIRRLKIRYYLNKPYEERQLMDRLNDIYDDIYPKAIIEMKKELPNNKDRNFLGKLLNVIKKRIGD